MKLTIKQVALSLMLFLISSMYMFFAHYYFTQRDITAEVLISRIKSDLSELSYIISKQVKKEPIETVKPLLDRKSANTDYLNAIAIFKGQQVVMSTDHRYITYPNANELYTAPNVDNFTLLHSKQALKTDVHYFEGKIKKYYTLIFYIDKAFIKQNFVEAKRDFILFFILIPIIFIAIVWLVLGRLIVKPLEALRQYAYYNSKLPAPFKVKEIEYIRASMVQTFNRLAQEKEELYKLSRTDSLSGLANRSYLNERVAQIIDLSNREKKEFALLFLDLDHFKSINDSLGHDIGDQLLKSIAHEIKRIVRLNDVVARVGGDEFVIVLTHYKGELELYEIIERIQTQLMKPWVIKTYPIHVTSSIGVTVFPKDGNDIISLLKNADIAMYEAKARGRRGYHFFTEALNVKTQEYIEITNSMREALKNGNFKLYYQPLNDVKTGEIYGAEALIRWTNSANEYISPNLFIPIAEQNGFIIELGKWVLETAIKQLKTWQNNDVALKISINVAALQVQQQDFVSHLKFLITTNEVQASNISLEITENVFLNDSEVLHKTFSEIKALGVQISLDDFGTGYSSLSYLKTFPIDILKIDKAFLDDYDTEAGAIFIETIVNMANTLKLRVVAEGVETLPQLTYLQSLNCHCYQGYYCSQPVEINRFNKLYSESLL